MLSAYRSPRFRYHGIGEGSCDSILHAAPNAHWVAGPSEAELRAHLGDLYAESRQT